MRGGGTLTQDGMCLLGHVFDLHARHGAIMALEAPIRKHAVIGQIRASANRTMCVGTRGRSWTPRCPGESSGLLRWPVVDVRGPGNSPENQTVVRRRCLWLSSQGSSACLVPRRIARTSAYAAYGKKGKEDSHDHAAGH